MALSLVIGTLLAFYCQGSRSRLRHLVQLAIFLPFLMPPIVTGWSPDTAAVVNTPPLMDANDELSLHAAAAVTFCVVPSENDAVAA